MNLNIRTKIFVAVFALILVIVGATGLILSQALKGDILERIEGELRQHAEMARVAVESAPEEGIVSNADSLADRLGEAASARVTIILENGQVIGDSNLSKNDVEKVKNHSDRAEVQSALSKGFGKAQRFSSTLDHDMLYIAVTYARPDSRGVVRISRPLSEVSESVFRVKVLVTIAGLIGLVIAALMSAILSHFFSRTLRILVEYARQMVEGRRGGHIEVASLDELGGLAGSLNKLSEQLEQHMTDLAAQRDQFEAVLEGMSEAVLALDENQKVTLINRAGIMLLGLSGRQPVGHTLLEIIRVPDLHELTAGVKSESDQSLEFELPGDPARKILAGATHPRTGGVVVVLHDVTELRRLESIRRDFVSNVSHELRTPVSIIRANAETLLGGALDEREAAVNFLNSMLTNAERLSNLIADLLDISRIEEGKFRLAIENVPVALALRRTAAALETQAIDKNFFIRVEPVGKLEVRADAKALDQVLFNLVDNAVKYAKKGGRVILRALEYNGRVRLEVEDDGLGIAPEHQERLFERFYRVDPGRSREMGGTGLGLAIVKHLVTAMGGEVGIKSAKPHGSIFWLTLSKGSTLNS
ncbi:MAG: cell wall metabolism sensor histidine kinase WalK [Proteobacteria bacterium]|nr:cell wall metabolism sensor histidine kinase WalK [Pseudomonadota bacterium]